MTFSLRRFIFSSLAVWLTVTVLGVYFLIHLHKFINFGIDLVGGTYISLEVQMDKAVESDLASRMFALSSRLESAGQPAPTSSVVHDDKGVMTFASEEAARTAENYLATDLRVSFERSGATLSISMTSEELATLYHEALQGNIAVLRRRLDPFGTGEITIASRGDRNIIIELPNVHDSRQAKAMIGKTALLEIKLVADSAANEAELLKKHGGKVPEGMVVAQGKGERSGRGEVYLVPQFTELTGRLLKDARSDFDHVTGESVVAFSFKPEGADRFAELTRNNIGRRIAVLVDGVVETAPVVQSEINGDGRITGNFTPEAAQALAGLLKSGAFVAPVTFEEERHIGPSLGAESIHAGLLACCVGLLLLLIFGLFMYKLAGLLAFLVLLYNILLILFAMAWLGATLTLPGIAGMILTIGMAIDASILIYERVREELHAGVPLRKAIDTGFSGAMAVILDANITHFLVALVLYKLGAGPIKGFAVTMIIGIVSTLLTGILLLRSIFNYLTQGLGVSKISI